MSRNVFQAETGPSCLVRKSGKRAGASRREAAGMIYGQRVRLWALERHDLMKNYQWANMRELIRLAGMTPYPKSVADLERWYDLSQSNGSEKIFTIKNHEGEYLGNIELRDIDWWSGKAELGIVIGEASAMQQGIGQEAIHLLCHFAYTQMRMERISARVLEFNHRAQKTFEACGFVREGTERSSHFSDGRHWDVYVYSRLKDDPFVAPGEVTDEAASNVPLPLPT